MNDLKNQRRSSLYCSQKWLLLFCLLLGLSSTGFSQPFASLSKKIAAYDSINTLTPREKLFMHYDRPFYKIKDTLWMKGYILAAGDYTITDSTGIAYIEIINTANEVVKRTAAPCYWGRFQSSIALNEDDFPQGSYTLRAYTNWMRNFGDSLLYESRFTVINPIAGEWNARVREVTYSGNRISLSAELTTNNLNPIAHKKIMVRVRSKNRNLLRLQGQTDGAGNLYIDTLLKGAIEHRDLVLEIADKEDLKLQIPVKTAGSSAIDLQFLPEGGSFIAGRPQLLGFKALNVYGKGIDVKGVIRNEEGKQVASFAAVHKGMGVVTFTPQPGGHYTAFPENGQPVKLPDPQSSGTLLQVINDPVSDSFRVIIGGTPDLNGRKYFFAATTGGLCFAKGPLTLSERPHRLSIAKRMPPSGITRLVLYDSLMRPVNERAVFIWHKDPLQLALTPDKPVYHTKDSVSLLLTVNNGKQQPVAGSFSLAVIDTSQVQINNLSENIISYMLLSSELKGAIEEPYYYFQDPTPQAVEALMLTQGWVRYEWPPQSFKFPREHTFRITGKATNIFNKPFVNTKVTAFGTIGKSSIFAMDTITDQKGVFTLEQFPYFTNDSVSMVIKGVNKKGKAFNIGLEVDEPVYPPYAGAASAFEHQNILLDTATARFVNKQVAIRKLIKKNGEYLDEVVVKTNAGISGSKNLNKSGGADQVINEKIMEKTPKATLLDVLYKQVKGFRQGSPPKSLRQMYMINSNMVRFIIDGTDLNFFYQPSGGGSNDYLLFLDSYLKYFSAEDIRGIEVMNHPRYNASYRSHYLSTAELMSTGPASIDFSFVEITTRTGSGPFLKKTPGMYLYRPVVPVIAKQFYSPRYATPDDKTMMPDMRTTVYWNPEIITNQKGEARVSFFTSESTGNYMILVQGINLTGGLGVLYQPLEIQKPGN
ncbi:Plug domain-containing protein [Niabella pedocola]|uniref:Plug domain-containing protein n=1 Tax=Niabella pedocola TaxID=1752077 RepID=A0ABS8PT71_9BACT|nr:Plug domain-containing protein [Niabella pedocola]MCD2423512.1 Plug domain-containing protein [Niabella pedocola]